MATFLWKFLNTVYTINTDILSRIYDGYLRFGKVFMDENSLNCLCLVENRAKLLLAWRCQ